MMVRPRVSNTMELFPNRFRFFILSLSTFSTLMYATGTEPFTGQQLFVERIVRNKIRQKAVLSKQREASRRPSGKGVFRKDHSSR
jgi:hypothetical protein